MTGPGGVPVAGDLEEAVRYIRTAVRNDLHRTPPRFLDRLLTEYDRRGAELARLRAGESWTHGDDPERDMAREALEARDRARADLAEHNRMHEIAVDDLAVRCMELSGLLRGMARRVGRVRFERRVDLMAALDGAVGEMNAARAQVAAIRALADRKIAENASAVEHGSGHAYTRAAAERSVARAVLAVLDGSPAPAGGCHSDQTPAKPAVTDTNEPDDADELLLVCKPARMSGRPTVGHSRLPVTTLLEFLRAGDSVELVRSAYPSVTAGQVRVVAALRADLDDRDEEDVSPVSPREDETPEPARESRIVDDGFGNEWVKCGRAECGLQVVRPGKTQCWCDGGPGYAPHEAPCDCGCRGVNDTAAPPDVHDAMRAYGIDPATYVPEIVASTNTTPQDKGVVYSLRLTGPELELLQAAASKRSLLIGRFIKQAALTAAVGAAGSVSTTPDPAATDSVLSAARGVVRAMDAAAWVSKGAVWRAIESLRAALAGTATTAPAHSFDDGPGVACGCCEIDWQLCRGLHDKGMARCCSDCTHNLAGVPTSSPLIGTWADPEFRAHAKHKHPVADCGYCPPEDES